MKKSDKLDFLWVAETCLDLGPERRSWGRTYVTPEHLSWYYLFAWAGMPVLTDDQDEYSWGHK